MNKRHNKWEICRTGMLAGLLLCAGIGTAFADHVIVDTDYVLKNKDKPGVVLVDARVTSRPPTPTSSPPATSAA